MKVREENCNLVLLAAVTLVSLGVAGIVALLEPATEKQETATPPACPNSATTTSISRFA